LAYSMLVSRRRGAGGALPLTHSPGVGSAAPDDPLEVATPALLVLAPASPDPWVELA
jgi:hypothetical protein